MSNTIPLDVTQFLDDLGRRDLAAKTIAAYRMDLTSFARWFPDSAREPVSARAVTPTDLRDYKSYLRTVERRQAATINRRFAALRAFFRWAKGAGLVTELPTEHVSGVPAAPRPSTWRSRLDTPCTSHGFLGGGSCQLAQRFWIPLRRRRHRSLRISKG